MDYKLTTLPNGLWILTIPMPSLESATVTGWVETGSRNEDKKLQGISHFLEHMAFKGSKKFPSPSAVTGFLDGLGAEYNAGTSHERTDFYVKVRVGILEKIGDVFQETIYPEHPLGRDIAGILGSVKTIKREDFLKYRQNHYGSNNM